MRPSALHSKIFLDSGDSSETRQIISMLGFLDGQTTNPTLVSKNPYAKKRFEQNDKFSESEILDFYKKVVGEISALIPNGSVSIEVYADQQTSTDTMLTQALEFNTWIPNAHIKYPITEAGLLAAVQSIQHGLKVNMTLCFSQNQAAAVYAATIGAQKGDVFVSPFIGRLDDIGLNGIDLIKNIMHMYESSDHHTDVLSASVRTLEHFYAVLALKTDIVTAPFSVLESWAKAGAPLPDADFTYKSDLKEIAYLSLDLDESWQSQDITHELTAKGIDRFASDWNSLIR